MIQSNIQRSETVDDDHEWIERVGKVAYDLVCNRINSDFIVKSSDPVLLGHLELAIELYLDPMPSALKPAFQQMLADIKARREKVGKSLSRSSVKNFRRDYTGSDDSYFHVACYLDFVLNTRTFFCILCFRHDRSNCYCHQYCIKPLNRNPNNRLFHQM